MMTMVSCEATFHARPRKIAPATTKAIHPASARARGERLCGRGPAAARAVMPASPVMVEGLGRAGLESRAVPQPGDDLDMLRRDAQHVERVGRLACALGGCRSRLHHERRES